MVQTTQISLQLVCLITVNPGQDALDNATGPDSLYVFDELGLVSYATSGTGRLLTHVIFHPRTKKFKQINPK